MSDRAARWGVQARYVDTAGERRQAPPASVQAVLDALRRGEERDEPPGSGAVHVCRPDQRVLPEALRGARLVTEDGASLGPVASLPPDLPLGYHTLERDDGGLTTLVVAPGACHLPDDLWAWGWALQLFSARSRQSWGMGDLADARAVAGASRRAGGQPVLLLNPVHAVNPVPEPEASPYSAGSRCFRNPIYLRIDQLPGAAAMAEELEPLAGAGRALNDERRIDRAEVWRLKRAALERLWAVPHSPARSAAEAAMTADPVLGAFAAFSAAVDVHGGAWSRWPAELRRRDGTGWGAFTRDHADRVAFHAWLQGLVGDQLAGVQGLVPVLHDLAVGTDREGFDAWYWQDVFVLDGTRIGAPSDQFNTQGQDWGLPPMDPWRLRAAAYEPVVRMLRCAFEHGSGVRLDHVMGLFRLFWIPPGRGPDEGVYVRQPEAELLDVVALESVRAGGFVVGEDLGTVEDGVREELARRRMLAYRVVTLAEDPPAAFPELALAAASTHDLPTVAGLWTGADLAAQQQLAMAPNVEDTRAARRRLRGWLGVDDDAAVTDVVEGTYRLLAEAPSLVVVAQLEDAAGVEERPNMPGTVGPWPNWSLALPRPLEVILAEEATATVAAALAGRLRPSGRGPLRR